jgi:hypothetical protein
MSDRIDADPEALRQFGDTLRDGVGPMLTAGAGIPSAEAGLMTAVIETGILRLLEGLQGFGSAVAEHGGQVLLAAVNHLRTDEAVEAQLLQTALGWSSPQANAQVAADDDARWAQLKAENPTQVERMMDVLTSPAEPQADLFLIPDAPEPVTGRLPGASEQPILDLLIGPLEAGEVEQND